MRLKQVPELLKRTFNAWWEDNPFRLGAALAYYTIFSLAPTVLIAVAVASLFFEREAAQGQLLREINQTVGPRVGEAIASIAKASEENEGGGMLATLIGFAVLLFGASTVFAQLQDALNLVWDVKPKKDQTWLKTIRDRFWSFTVVLGVGFVLLVSLLLSAALSALNQFMTPESVPGGTYLWQGINWLVSFGLVTLLFALIYKFLPDVHIDWSDVWIGAAVTALLFSIGKYLIGLYLGQSTWISAYGAAGSIIVILIWVYYSSQIFLFGAAFTRVQAQEAHGSIVPKENAEPMSSEARLRQGMTPHSTQPAS